MPRIIAYNDLHALVAARDIHAGFQISDDHLGVYGIVERVEITPAGDPCKHGWSGPWNSRPCSCDDRVAITMVRGALDWEIDEVDAHTRLRVVCSPGASTPLSHSNIFSDLV